MSSIFGSPSIPDFKYKPITHEFEPRNTEEPHSDGEVAWESSSPSARRPNGARVSPVASFEIDSEDETGYEDEASDVEEDEEEEEELDDEEEEEEEEAHDDGERLEVIGSHEALEDASDLEDDNGSQDSDILKAGDKMKRELISWRFFKLITTMRIPRTIMRRNTFQAAFTRAALGRYDLLLWEIPE